MKASLIMLAVRLLMGAIVLGLGIWYLSSSIGGAALTYTSMDNFMAAIGATNGDVANVNGCFMCGYISELFGVIGRAAEMFWLAIVDHIWILMAVGFGIFLFIYSAQYIFDAAKKTAALDDKEKKLELKGWFDKVWRQGLRIIFVGALMGMLGMGGTTAMRTIANITITPVMYVGAELAMAATGVSDAAQCNAISKIDDSTDVLNPILNPFMCVVGNINSVMLAGAAGGFAMMNYAWMGMGGGAFTWVAGLGLVIMFLIIGFNLFFEILSVVFKLVFIIIFMPILLASAAYEPVWAAASGLVKKALNMLLDAAIQIVRITLKTLIIYATVAYAADTYFPGPTDGYSAVLPPMMNAHVQNPDARTLSVMNVFSECERVSLTDGKMDADKFKACFIERRNQVERRYPGAFDFLGDGWDFMLLMLGLFLLYFYAISPKVDEILGKNSKSDFDFGGNVLQLGKNITWNFPKQIFDTIAKTVGKK